MYTVVWVLYSCWGTVLHSISSTNYFYIAFYTHTASSPQKTFPRGFVQKQVTWISQQKIQCLQSGRSSLAKHGGAYFSAVYGFMKDPIAAPGPYENQEC